MKEKRYQHSVLIEARLVMPSSQINSNCVQICKTGHGLPSAVEPGFPVESSPRPVLQICT